MRQNLAADERLEFLMKQTELYTQLRSQEEIDLMQGKKKYAPLARDPDGRCMSRDASLEHVLGLPDALVACCRPRLSTPSLCVRAIIDGSCYSGAVVRGE